MTSALPRFPPYPIRGVHVRHQKQNCSPQFAEIEVDFEPTATEGFVFEVAEGLTVEYEPAEALPRFFAAVAAGIEELLHSPEQESERVGEQESEREGEQPSEREGERETGQDTRHAVDREFVIATRVVLRRARADAHDSHELAFKIAGYLAARKAVARVGGFAGLGGTSGEEGPTRDRGGLHLP
ncbi:hypothetical protein [Streptomyces venezuelae]|uniref:hypothetical protein n=1 Tax=Streptomyces venezuelae TaxID=54571 RepID=UPI00343D7562